MKTPTFATRLAIAVICAAALTNSVGAIDSTGYVTLNGDDANNTSSFNSAGKWSSGKAPEPGRKFLVQGKNRIMRSPASKYSTPFAGDSLSLADNALFYLKSSSGSTLSANWILYDGILRHNSSSGNGNPWIQTIAGTVDVRGTETAPAKIQVMEKYSATISVTARLAGEAEAVLLPRLHSSDAGSKSIIEFSGDNSGYKGRFLFKSTSLNKADGRLRFKGATSAGVTGDPSPGVPFLTISGESTAKAIVELVGVHMDSRFTIECAHSDAQIELTGDDILFGATLAGSSAGIPVKVSGNAMLRSASPLALDFTGGGRILARRNQDGTIESSSIAEGSTLTLADGRIPVRFDGVIPHTNANFSATLLTIPTSVRAISAADIDLDADDFGLMTIDVSVADGIQTVSLRAGNVVYYSAPNTASGWGNWAAYNQAAKYWSDNRAVHPDADYLIGYDVPTGCMSLRGCQAAFAGRSLSFAKGGSLVLKGRITRPDRIDDLRMFPGSMILTGDNLGVGSDYNALSGSLKISGKADDDYVLFRNDTGGVLNLMTTFYGKGPVRFENKSPGTFQIVLSGASVAFTGKMEFYGSNAGRALRVTISDESNLGGNPAAFNAAQTWFHGCVELVATNDIAIDDANRGITFSSVAKTTEVQNPVDTFNVASGATLTLDVPMVVDMNLVKTGAGTLAIGGTISGTVSNLAVNAGSVMPVTRQASGALRYTMAAGTGLALALAPVDADVAADGLYVEDASHLTLSGSSLPVTIRGAIPETCVTVKCGLLNVPASMADAIAAALGANATFANTKTGRTRTFPIERELLSGDRVRFFATVVKGPTVMIVR